MAQLWTLGGKLLVINGTLCLQDTCPCPCGNFCTPPPQTMYVQEKGTSGGYGCDDCATFWASKKALTYVDDGEYCKWVGSFEFDCTSYYPSAFDLDIELILTEVATAVQVDIWSRYYSGATLVNTNHFSKIVTGEFDCENIGDVPFVGPGGCSRWCFEEEDWVCEVST